MADYCTVAELKTHLRVADTVDDTPLAIAVTAASEAIDHATNSSFAAAGAAVAREYGVDCHLLIDGRPALRVDPFQTATGLIVKTDTDNDGVYETTLTLGTDFVLWPENAPERGKPWTHIVIPGLSASSAYFPWTYAGVQVTASFGYTAIPAAIKQACLIQAARFFSRRDSQYGVAGSPEIGSEVRLLARLDPDVAVLLGTFKRHWAAF